VSSLDDILIMGDSMAELSFDILAKSCSGKSVINLGVSGSTANEFFTGQAETGGCIDGDVCSAKDAFKSNYGSGYTHVWLSVGGNDWLGAQCDADIESTLEDKISGVIDSVFKESPKGGIKLLITGYGYPSDAVGECPKGNEKVDRLQNAIQQAAVNNVNADSILFVQATLELFGGSTTNYSDKKWFADAIHLNEAGYKKLFSLVEIQDFLKCNDEGGCNDSTSYRYQDKSVKSCAWISRKEPRKTNLCPKWIVKKNCPRTCNNCPCEDSVSGQFSGPNGVAKKCTWLNKDKRTTKWCKLKTVADLCPKRCSFNTKRFKFTVDNGDKKFCSYINNTIRIKKFCKGNVAAKCAKSCNKC